MKRRAFYIPMFICLALATGLAVIGFTLMYAGLESVFKEEQEVGDAIVLILSVLIFVPFTGASWVFTIPVFILGGFYIKKALKNSKEIWPAITSIVLCSLYILIPIGYIMFLSLR